MPNLSKKTKIILIALFIVTLLFIASATAMERENITLIEKGLRDMVAPLKRGAVVVYEKFGLIPQFFTGVSALSAENEQLKTEIATLQSQINLLEEAGLENTYLREMLGMAEEIQEWSPAATTIIGRSSASWYNTITIKGGENKNFAKNMPLITTEGLVGRIISVSEYTSEVILITDKECAVGAMVQISQTPGVVEGAGKGESVYMIHIPYGARLMKDQVVITSGLGGIFPRGLRIGYITEINPDKGDLMLKANIKPFVDFERLGSLFVLTNVPDYARDSSLPILTQPDAEDNPGENGEGREDG